MKSAYIAVILAAVLATSIGYLSISGMIAGSPGPGESVCAYGQLNYYYRPGCHFCQQVEGDGSLEKLEGLGVRIEKYNVVEWGMYGIYATPTFEFGSQRIAGYMDLQELKGLLGCDGQVYLRPASNWGI